MAVTVDPFPDSRCNYYLGTENGCFILTADGCRILLRRAKSGPYLGQPEPDDNEVLLIMTAMMNTVCRGS